MSRSGSSDPEFLDRSGVCRKNSNRNRSLAASDWLHLFGGRVTYDRLVCGTPGKGVSAKEGSWGYRLLVVDDPDGSQLFFNYPNETA